MNNETGFPMERYSLTLRHEYILPNGQSTTLDEPVVCTVHICDMYRPEMTTYVKNEALRRLMYEMATHLEVKI